MTSIVFRTDASPAIGGGHVMRCLTLADRLKKDGWDTTFCCSAETLETVPQLKSGDHRLSDPSTNETRAVDWLVLDHYGLGIEFEKKSRSWAKQIMVLDDLPVRKHDCDILLDQNLDRALKDYRGLIPGEATVATGTEYALLRPQFAAARSTAISQTALSKAPFSVLISMGLTDPGNTTGRILEALAKSNIDIIVEIVLGKNAPHLDAIRRQVGSFPFDVTLLTGVMDMAGLLANTDLVVGAAGSSAWERCCLGVPTLLVVLAENQRPVATALAERSAAVNLGLVNDLSEDDLAREIGRVLQTSRLRATLSRNAALICDGLGAGRVSLLLEPEHASDKQPVRLRLAKKCDGETLLKWQSVPETRRYSRNPGIPDRQEHFAWFHSKLADPTVIFHMIEHANAPAGMIRLDQVSGKTETYEINILTALDKYGLGIASAALRSVDRLLPEATLLAEVLSENSASKTLFTKAGFIFEDNHFIRRPVAVQFS